MLAMLAMHCAYTRVVLQIKQVHDIRWLSMDGCAQRIAYLYPALLLYFQEAKVEIPECKWFVDELTDLEFLLALEAFLPLLHELNRLVKLFQSRDVFLFDVTREIEASERMLREHFEGPKAFSDNLLFQGYHVLTKRPEEESPLKWRDTDFLKYCVKEKEFPMQALSHGRPGRSAYEPVTIRNFNDVMKRVQSLVKNAAAAVRIDMSTRFPTSSLMRALSMIQIPYWRDPRLGIRTFEKDVEQLIQYYATAKSVLGLNGKPPVKVDPVLDAERLQTQAAFFADWMTRNCEDFETTQQLWLFLDTTNITEAMGEYARLAHLVLSLPIGSVECERVFSHMNLLKSSIRNLMGEDYLNMSMRVATCDHSAKSFNFNHALRIWKASKQRYCVAK